MVVTLLARIAAAETRCALVRQWKAQVLQQVAAKIDAAFLWAPATEVSVRDMVEEGHGFTSLRGRKRRRRLDRDLLLGRVAKSMRLNIFSGASQAARASDIDCSVKSAHE